MISKETAQLRLREFYNPRATEDQLACLEKLSTELSILGQMLIRAGPAWEKFQQTVTSGGENRYLSLMQLGKVSARDRQRLFYALFPGLALHVEAAWNLFDRLPYQASHNRRPFRNPYQHTDEARINWLIRLPFAVQGYEAQNITWLAAWAPHLGGWGSDVLGYLFAAAIDGGEETSNEILEILIASARGTHETGMMGRHVVRGLLCSTRPEGWAFLEGLLVAAQREEGLRQVLLEAIDEAHPQAFRRMLRVVVEHHLTRFSALIRAFGVWFGLPLEAVPPKEVSQILSQILTYLKDPAECEKAVQHTDPQQAYFALWAMAFDNVHLAIPYARNLAHTPEVGKRFAAVHFLAQVNLPEIYPDLLSALKDEDLRIPARIVASLNIWEHQALFQSGDLFEGLEGVLVRLKHKQQTIEPLVWNWTPLVIERQMVADKLLDALGNHSPKRLFPYLPYMGPRSRERVVRLLKAIEEKDGECIQILLSLTGDASQSVRELALEGIQGVILTEGEVVRLEGLLSRQATDLHRGIIQFLLALPDERLFDSLQRLFAHKQEKVRLSALELLKEARHQRRAPDQIQALARAYQQRPTLSEFETRLLNEILVDVLEQPSLKDALGLMNPQNRTPATPVKPRNPKIKFISPSALTCLKSLDAWIEQHRNQTIEIPHRDKQTTELLGNIRYAWMLYPGKPEPLHKYPHFLLKEFVERWEQATAKDRRDKDGLLWMRAFAAAWLFEDMPVYMFQAETKGPTQDIQQHYGISVDFTLNYPGLIRAMVEWLVWAHPVAEEVDYLLDALETSVTRIPQAELIKMEMGYGGHLVRHLPNQKLVFLNLARWHRALRPEQWQPTHHARLWQVVRWLDEPEAGLWKIHERLEDALWAFQTGSATRDDLFNRFLGARPENPYTFGNGFSDLRMFSPRKLAPREQALVEKFPILREIVDACRERILDVECQRGELPTAATIPAGSIRSVPGMSNLFRLLKAFGNADFERGHAFWVNQDRARVFSHLIRSSYPLEGDTLEAFARLVTQHQIPEKTLLTLAVFAPQWVNFVQASLAWEHLSEAVWWLYAHTKDRHWAIDEETRAEWVARISEYTPLTADELMDGAVDVAWFKRMYEAVGESRWGKLYEIAMYASDGIGHTRARLFADAMLGKLSFEKEMERIRKKRHQDSVRALGLIPLSNLKNPQDEILQRYEVIQEFLRTSKKFGSQRQASEKLAASIGLQNLARTAGYSDPQRLEWAMEVEAIADLSAGAITVQVGEVQVSLCINNLGEPVLEINKKGKPLKTIPPALKKLDQVAELVERKQALERQVSRMRQSLEQAMCRGDRFTRAELKTFFKHPILKEMIEQLIFVSEGKIGYPIRLGEALYHQEGHEIPLGEDVQLRIAHPLDLLASDQWPAWQQECFISERIQPFKQVFRELYVLTSTEQQEGNLSRRYAGQQVNGRQASALFAGRGWVVAYQEGVQKVFHAEGLAARVGFLFDWNTPAEVEGSTIEEVRFTKRGEWTPVPLENVPPRIFSEVMRDLDLVVSVAHAGGVDPEASASSLVARSALIRETSALLALKNVMLSEKHVLIEGRLANYNVHLGSGVVHKQPGGAMCIIPVHSQQRGRIFLPFTDQDPKTAEIVSKVILLARDDQIKDPTILEQILK